MNYKYFANLRANYQRSIQYCIKQFSPQVNQQLVKLFNSCSDISDYELNTNKAEIKLNLILKALSKVSEAEVKYYLEQFDKLGINLFDLKFYNIYSETAHYAIQPVELIYQFRTTSKCYTYIQKSQTWNEAYTQTDFSKLTLLNVIFRLIILTKGFHLFQPKYFTYDLLVRTELTIHRLLGNDYTVQINPILSESPSIEKANYQCNYLDNLDKGIYTDYQMTVWSNVPCDLLDKALNLVAKDKEIVVTEFLSIFGTPQRALRLLNICEKYTVSLTNMDILDSSLPKYNKKILIDYLVKYDCVEEVIELLKHSATTPSESMVEVLACWTIYKSAYPEVTYFKEWDKESHSVYDNLYDFAKIEICNLLNIPNMLTINLSKCDSGRQNLLKFLRLIIRGVDTSSYFSLGLEYTELTDIMTQIYNEEIHLPIIQSESLENSLSYHLVNTIWKK